MTAVRDKCLSVIIVNWNSCAYLRQCLYSLYTTTSGLAFEIIVVDNASYDGSQAMLQAEFSEVRFIQSPDNLGFAKANNLAVEHSLGRNLLFLNPDTQLRENAIGALLAVLDSVPDAGIVGARLLNEDLSLQTSCVQAIPSVLNQLLDLDPLRKWFPKANLWGTRALFESKPGPTAVGSVSGACLMIRRNVFEAAGGFSTVYFMYAEDLDLCFNVGAAGWNIYYCSEAVIVHYGGCSAAEKPDGGFSAVMMRESLYGFFLAHGGWIRATVYQLSIGVAAVFRLVALVLIMIVTLGSFRRRSLYAALEKWFRILRWTLGIEGWAKSAT